MTDDPIAVLDAQALRANEEWARGLATSALEVRPRRRMAVLTCMDSRYTAQGVLGLALGDAHVLRNAGGRVTDDVVRSLVVSAHVLGTRGCVVIHHTNCGLHGATNEALRATVAAATSRDVSGADLLPFTDIAESVREDLGMLRASPLLPADYELPGLHLRRCERAPGARRGTRPPRQWLAL